MSELVLIPQVFSDSGLLAALESGLAEQYDFIIQNQKKPIDLTPFLDPARGQYDAVKILQHFEHDEPPKILICTTLDIYIPIFTFVFGLAKLNGNNAIISSHRLTNKYYGLPDDKELLSARLLKEALHELGHTAGLRHCQQYNCVMASSSTAEEIDVKTSKFCSTCEPVFRQGFNF